MCIRDSLWDISPYLEVAARKTSRITRVVDSHSHADHVSGARRLVEATGASLLLPRAAQVSYPADRLDPGQKIRFGEVLSLIHISEPTRLLSISYAVFCLKKKKNK